MSTSASHRLQNELTGLATVKTCQGWLRVTAMTVHNWRESRKLPAIVIPSDTPGGRPALRFVKADVKAWALGNNVAWYGD